MRVNPNNIINVEWSVEHRDSKSVISVCDRIDECAALLHSATDQVRKRINLTEAESSTTLKEISSRAMAAHAKR
jgi:hypothetical protein